MGSKRCQRARVRQPCLKPLPSQEVRLPSQVELNASARWSDAGLAPFADDHLVHCIINKVHRVRSARMGGRGIVAARHPPEVLARRAREGWVTSASHDRVVREWREREREGESRRERERGKKSATELRQRARRRGKETRRGDGAKGVKGVAISVAFATGVGQRRDREMVRERAGAEWSRRREEERS